MPHHPCDDIDTRKVRSETGNAPMQKTLQTETVATLTPADLDQVAAIHIESFPQSFLSALGQGTVKRYYSWLLTGPHDVTAFGVRSSNGELVGFALGGVFKGALIGFLKKNCVSLAWSIMLRPWLLVRPNHRNRFISGVRTVVPFLRCEAKNGGSPWPAPKTLGIIAIAVTPKYGRFGHGRRLMDAYDRIARERKFSRMQLRVNPANEVAISFYQKLGWFKTGEPWTGVMFKPCLESQRMSENTRP
jgi:ribosomal protein S18 acetylase RimI-like enzyme